VQVALSVLCCSTAALLWRVIIALYEKRNIVSFSLVSIVAVLLVFPGIFEADRLWGIEASPQADELRRGFSGKLENANCTVPEDGERIRQEWRQQGCENEVEQAIAGLIDMGLSTPNLRFTTKCRSLSRDLLGPGQGQVCGICGTRACSSSPGFHG